MIGASAALAISDIPCDGPHRFACQRRPVWTASIVVNPTRGSSAPEATYTLSSPAPKTAVLMVEAGAKEVSEEDDARQAILFAHEEIKKHRRLHQRHRQPKVGKPKKLAFEPQ